MKRIGLALTAIVVLVAGVSLLRRGHHGVSQGASTSGQVGILKSGISLMDLDNHPVSLSRFTGHVVLVNFWATWCGLCKIEIPWLMQLQEKYGARGFTVVGVAMDDEGRKAVAPFVSEQRFALGNERKAMNYPIVLGNDAVADKFGGIIGFPTTVLISKDGRQVRRMDGLLNYEDMSKAIESLL